jgi:hypothetical protein
MRVPVVPSGKDKIIYMVEYNYNSTGVMHGEVFVKDQKIERFRTSWINNPFAAHYNSKLYSRYLGTRVPASIIDSSDFLITLKIDLRQSSSIHVREIGSHDIF